MVRPAADYFRADDTVAEYRAYDDLRNGEQAILERVRPSLPSQRMLDIGVGGGRTTVHFAPLAGEYVGIDVSEPMVEACRTRFADSGWRHVSFEVADVRGMPQLESESFDFVLFSWNGLDSVGGADERRRALAEIRRVCRTGALFCFSSHNLDFVPLRLSFRWHLGRVAGSLPRRLAAAAPRFAWWRLRLPSLRVLSRLESAILVDSRHGWRGLPQYFIRPPAQLRELEAAGFAEAAIFTRDGFETRDPAAVDDCHWVYYTCRRP